MKKMNNKGFSLVELIIVIAIMAVLIAVLAPQYLKYVEKSRVSADGQTADEFYSALQVIASDPDLADSLTAASYAVTSDTTGAITIDSNLKPLLKDVMDTNKNYTFKSKTFKAANRNITMSWDSTNKLWKISDNIPGKSGS